VALAEEYMKMLAAEIGVEPPTGKVTARDLLRVIDAVQAQRAGAPKKAVIFVPASAPAKAQTHAHSDSKESASKSKAKKNRK
jgi:hypothetical protein